MWVQKGCFEIYVKEKEKEDEIPQRLTRNAKFANKLYGFLSEKEGNFVFSPMSLHITLSMILAGAMNPTRRILWRASDDEQNSPKINKSILKCLKSTSEVDIKVKRKIFVLSHFPHEIKVNKNFRKILAKYFHSKFKMLSLHHSDSTTIKKINNWVKKKTSGSETDFIERLEIRPGLLPVDVVYFKSDWKLKFESCGKAPFYYGSKETSYIDVEMIESVGYYKYMRNDKFQVQVIHIPYKDEQYKMIILLPYEKNGLHDLEQKLQTCNTEQLFLEEAIDEYYIQLFLPKFKISETTKLKQPLTQLGLSNIFDRDEANFSKMTNMFIIQKICVREILQKCIIEMKEGGSDPAPQTGTQVLIVSKTSPPVDYTVKVDHPAIFMLAGRFEKRTVILFYGRLQNPNFWRA